MTLANTLLEISAFPLSMKGKSFYLGISKEEEARAIFLSGTISLPKPKRRGQVTTHVTLSTSLGNALASADLPLGKKLSSARIKQLGLYGYVFVVSTQELQDIEPSVESVGEFIQTLYSLQYKQGKELDPKGLGFLVSIWPTLDRDEQKAIIYDEEDARATIGRKILNGSSLSTITWMLTQDKYPYDLSNLGPVPFKTCHRLNRQKTNVTTEKDFFQKAEVVTKETFNGAG